MKRVCQTCKKMYETSPSRKLKYCSHKCYSKSRLGILPWNAGKKIPKEMKNKISISGKKAYAEGRHKKWNKGKKYHCHSEEWKIKLSKKFSGKNNPCWEGGKSFETYPAIFNNKLKEKIRKIDNYRCQECFRHQNELRTKTNKKYKLYIHHIDYNKKNCSDDNLISLCHQCHNQTNFNRNDWEQYFITRRKQQC